MLLLNRLWIDLWHPFIDLLLLKQLSKNSPRSGISKMWSAFFCAFNITGGIKNFVRISIYHINHNCPNLNVILHIASKFESSIRTDQILETSELRVFCVYQLKNFTFFDTSPSLWYLIPNQNLINNQRLLISRYPPPSDI